MFYIYIIIDWHLCSHIKNSKFVLQYIFQNDLHTLKSKRPQEDSLDILWRRWRQASTSPVNIKAVTLMTFLFLCIYRHYSSVAPGMFCVCGRVIWHILLMQTHTVTPKIYASDLHFVVFCHGRFYSYPTGLIQWHGAITPVPVKPPSRNGSDVTVFLPGFDISW